MKRLPSSPGPAASPLAGSPAPRPHGRSQTTPRAPPFRAALSTPRLRSVRDPGARARPPSTLARGTAAARRGVGLVLRPISRALEEETFAIMKHGGFGFDEMEV
jgi:hypothetical protein